MVGLIIAAAIGASILGSLITLGIIYGFYKKSKMAKKVKDAQTQEKIDLLIEAVKHLAQHNGMSYSEKITVFDKYIVDKEVLNQLKVNALANKAKLDTNKVSKKASKIKM